MLTIRELDHSYKGKRLEFSYTTEYYYDLEMSEDRDSVSFSFVRKPFGKIEKREFTDTLLSEWLEKPRLYGAFEGDREIGYLELSHESWNNRMRVANILVSEEYRGNGAGSLLMERAIQEAKAAGARMLVLETQSCNDKAIRFYRKHGFHIIGFDRYSYSNSDVEKREFRLEMGRMTD